MTEEDAQQEGCNSLDEFRDVWREINGDWQPDLVVDVIEMEYVGRARPTEGDRVRPVTDGDRCVNGTEQTVTVTFLSNHEVPVKDLDLESDDEELAEQAMSNAKPRGNIQALAESEQSLAADLRRVVDDDHRGDSGAPTEGGN